MNKILSLILALAMVASMLCVGASATFKEHAETGTDGSTTTIDGVTYTVATSAATLKSLLTNATPQKIILGKTLNISSQFSAGEVTAVTPGTVLEGNGYALHCGSTERTAPLFQFGKGVTTTFRNVRFGYKTTTRDLPMKFKDAAFFVEETTTADHRVIWDNVDLYLNTTYTTAYTPATGGESCSGAVCARPVAAYEFYGCDLDVTFTGAAIAGGWFGISFGEIYMNNCTVNGTVTGNSGFTGGFLGQLSHYDFRLINCTNYADVTGSRATGGFVGNLGTGGEELYFEYCKNYGAIKCTAGGAYEPMAGGFIGRFTSRQNTYFLGCENHGAISSNCAAGGFAGRSHDYDYDGSTLTSSDGGTVICKLEYRFLDCLNTGTVTASQYAGGIMGVLSPFCGKATFENCVNIGVVRATDAEGYAGNMAGMLNNATLKNCFMLGDVTATNAGAFAGLYANTYDALSGVGGTKTGTAPTFTNSYSHTNASYSGITTVTDGNRATMLAALKTATGYDLVPRDSADTSATPYQIATPRIRGMQTSKAASGKQDVRVIAVINSLESFSKVGFDVRIIKGTGIVFDQERETNLVYKAINNNSFLTPDGETPTTETITAESLGGRYIIPFTFRNVPTTEQVLFEVRPYAISADGTKTYTGAARAITGFGGEYFEEAAVLDGTQLSKYSVVYDADGTKGENELAKHLANKIAEVTGYAIPVFADNTTAGQNAAHKLELKASGGELDAAITASNGNVAITGGTAARLGDAVKYFLDQLNLKLAKGDTAWAFTSVQVPLKTDFAVMSYNAAPRGQNYDGAGGHRYDAVTDRIFDYLPDILTLQEPDRTFMQDSRMIGRLCGIGSSSGTEGVETGNGYYDIYWGKGRHTGVSGAKGDDSVSVILWAKDRYTCLGGGTFWLINMAVPGANPDVPGKMSTSVYYRCATWVKLTDKYTGETFVVVNTHLDSDGGDSVRALQATNLKRILQEKGLTSDPVLITGDMNANPVSTAISNIKNTSYGAYESLWEISRYAQVSPYFTQANAKIDWIFASQGTVEGLFYRHGNERPWYGAYKSDSGTWNEVTIRTPSDHPVCYAEMRFIGTTTVQ